MDSTVADVVADARAATPSAAVTLTVPDRDELRIRLSQARERGRAHLEQLLLSESRRLQGVRDRLSSALGNRMARARETIRGFATERLPNTLRLWSRSLTDRLKHVGLGTATRSLQRSVEAENVRLSRTRRAVRDTGPRAIDSSATQLGQTARSLDAASPLHVLARGYAAVENEEGESVSSVRDLSAGDEISLRLRDGRAGSLVTSVEPDSKEEERGGGDGVRGSRKRRGGDCA